MKGIGFIFIFLISLNAAASSNVHHLDVAPIDPFDKVSLKRGAKYFADYCFNCHSIAFMRFNRIMKDLEMTEDEINQQLLFTGAKIGDNMEIALVPKDAKQWFGTEPPDLSVVSRARGANWLYTYLRSFYQDNTRPWGVNNALFKDVAMPHVLWELQGLQVPKHETLTGEDGQSHQAISGFELVEKGTKTPAEFDQVVADIVNFLVYVGEPAKLTRVSLGKWVIAFLAVFFVVMYLLKKEYWRDVH